MEKNLLIRVPRKWVIAFFVIFSAPAIGYGQNLSISDFVLYGNTIQIASSSSLSGGSIGSNTLVRSSGPLSFSGNIYSGGTIALDNNNAITGRITAANSAALHGTILSIGSGTSIGGNIDVNGNIVVSGGIISGTVTHPAGTTYTGPAPGE